MDKSKGKKSFRYQKGTLRKRISIDEKKMIRDLILLQHIEPMVIKSLKEMELSSNILKRACLMTGQSLYYQIKKDADQVQKELKHRNIRVIENEQEELLVNYTILCRECEEHFVLTRDLMRTEIDLRLDKYTTEVEVLLRLNHL